MQIEEIEKILQESLYKPSSYHHVCYGGSAIKMVDVVDNNKEFKCKYQGDKNWLTPVCEKCTGIKVEEPELTDYEYSLNRGMIKLFENIKRAASAETQPAIIQQAKECH